MSNDLEETASSERWKRFGEYLRSCRHALAARLGRDVTIKEIADMVGIGFRQVSRLELGEMGTRYNTVTRLGKALRLSGSDLEQLYILAGFASPRDIVDDAEPIEEEAEMLRPATAEDIERIERKLDAVLERLPPLND